MKNFFNRFNEWLRRFMYGRYGFDQLGMAILILYLVLTTVSIFLNANTAAVNYVLLLLVVIFYYRVFSKNIYRRARENSGFLRWYEPVRHFFKKRISRMRKMKEYKYFRCPQCHTELRVPRGKGKIIVTCPSCHHSFEKKS